MKCATQIRLQGVFSNKIRSLLGKPLILQIYGAKGKTFPIMHLEEPFRHQNLIKYEFRTGNKFITVNYYIYIGKIKVCISRLLHYQGSCTVKITWPTTLFYNVTKIAYSSFYEYLLIYDPLHIYSCR